MTFPRIDNRYQPLALLGEGAMGLVWLVADTVLGRQVALKVVSTKLNDSEKSRLQFKQEFRLMTQLRHPHCCQVFDYGETADNEPYFTMEVVEGQGLDELGPQRPEAFRAVFAQLMLALGYIHGLGLVHGDLKSANVRLTPDGRVVLMDYGLMDYAGRAGLPIRGTPAYMAPELIRRAPIDRRSDLYAAGCLGYELLTGQLPFGGGVETGGARHLLRQHIDAEPEPLTTLVPDLPEELSRLVLKLLAKDPLARFQSASEVLQALGVEPPAGIGGSLLGSPMIGRGPVLAKLFKHLSRVVGLKPGGALWLTGPAGVGKSRLLEEFRFAAQLDGVRCPTGECFEHAQAPYGPFLGALKAIAPALDELPRELFKVHAPVLVKLAPELAGSHPVTPAPDLENPRSEMLRTQTALTQTLVALARARPYALTLENWQWADPLSAQLLGYLLRNLGDAPLLVLIATREPPTERVGEAEEVVLAGLPEAGLTRMLASMLGTTQVAPAFVTRILEASEGNPFLVERLLEHLVQSQLLQSQGGRWNTETALDGHVLPLGLQAVLARKFAGLSARARAIADLVAVIGRGVELPFVAVLLRAGEGESQAAEPEPQDLMSAFVAAPRPLPASEALGPLTDEALLDGVQELLQSQLMEQDAAEALSFVQDQVGELLYAQISRPALAKLHGRVARSIASQLAGPLDAAPLEQVALLARHALAGDLPMADTLAYALEAGERHRRLYAMDTAERFLASGHALLLEAPPQAFAPERLAFDLALGELKRQTGRAAEAMPLLGPAVAAARERGARPLGRLLGSLGKTQQMLQDFEGATTSFEASVATCLAEQDPTGASRALLASARVALFQGDARLALVRAEEGLRLASQSGDLTQRGLAHALIGYLAVASAPERLDEGADHLQSSLTLLAASGDRVALSTSYQLLGNARLILGELEGAADAFGHNQRIAFEIGSREEEAFAYINLGIVALERGDFAAALANARVAKEKVMALAARFPQGIALGVEAVALAHHGEDLAAIALADQSLAIAREIKHSYLEGLVLGYRAELFYFLGRTEEASAAARELAGLVATSGNQEPESRLHVLEAELARRAGRLDEAASKAELAHGAAVRAHARGVELKALAAKAHVAHARVDFQQAMGTAAEAIALARRIGARHEEAKLLGTLGEATLAMGQEGASRAFEAMLELARTLGDATLEAEACFGLAACRPYAGGPALATDAKTLFQAWLGRLSTAGQAAFTSYPERQRVLDGNYIGLSLPLRSRSASRGTQPLSLPPGFRGTNGL